MDPYPPSTELGATDALVLTADDLRYFSLSGEVEEYEIEAYLAGLMFLPALECDLLALAVNELIEDLPPRRRAPFRDDLVRAHAAAHDASDDTAAQ